MIHLQKNIQYALRRMTRLDSPLFFILVLTMSLSLGEVAYRHEGLSYVENLYSDIWHRLAGKTHSPQHTALVVVDETTLAAYPDDPLVFWTPHFAQAIQTLRSVGAKTIGADFLFSISPEEWLRKLNLSSNEQSHNYDMPFRLAIHQGQVILAATTLSYEAHDSFLLPSQDYLLSLPDFDVTGHIGLADLSGDADGAIRRFIMAPKLRLKEEEKQGAPRLTLGPLLATRSSQQDANSKTLRFASTDFVVDNHPRPIAYAGPPGTIPRVSLIKLLQPDALNNPEILALKGKTVLIGGEYLGMNDLHFTPYSGGWFGQAGPLMTGPEIQANIVEMLLSGRFIEPVSPFIRLMILISVLVIGIYGFKNLPPLKGLFILLTLSGGTGILAYIAFLRHTQLPLAHFQLAIFGSFLVVYSARLLGSERKRRQISTIFGRYVSESVVKLLIEGEKLPELGGETVNATILFSDIRNFTSISEQLGASEVVLLLNTYFEKACQPFLDEGGSIDKFIGDAIMVEFGTPLKHTDHALRSIRAALSLAQVAEEFRTWMKINFEGRNLPDFDVGIGIHTGEIVVGSIGSHQRMEYTAIGDTVNLASRLEGMTKELGCRILASESTVKAAGPTVITGRRSEFHVKGRKESVVGYEILGIKPHQSLDSNPDTPNATIQSENQDDLPGR